MMLKFFNLILLLVGFIEVPFVGAQHSWTPNLLNLFSDNFRNLLQQIPTSPLTTNSLPLIPQLSQSSLNSPLYDLNKSYNSKPKDLQYSDEDLANNRLSNNNQLSPDYLPAYNSFTSNNNYYNYQLNDNSLSPLLNQNINNYNQIPSKSQFDDDLLYDSLYLAKAKKNVESNPLINKNVEWNDDSNAGLNLNAYNLDNIYNNQYNYNRLPAIPDHLAFVPPPPNQPISNNLPTATKPITDLQQSPGSSNLAINNSPIATQIPNTNQLPYSYLRGKADYNSVPLNQPTSNSIEQQYNQAKPFNNFLQNNEIYSQDKAALSISLPSSPANLPTPTANLAVKNNLLTNSNLIQKQTSIITPDQPTYINSFSENSLHQLYQQFANVQFNGDQLKNPSVIYYDNFINHQLQPPAISPASNLQTPTESSSLLSNNNNLQTNLPTSTLQQNIQPVPVVDTPPINQALLINNKTPLTNSNQLTTNQLSSQLPNQLNTVQPTIDDQVKNLNSLATLTTSTGVAPNKNLEATIQPQVIKAAIRKKPASKIKRKNRNNQHDFGIRKSKKDELLEAIER